MPLYEVGIYNQKVRDYMDVGEKHPRLDDKWAEINYFDVDASSEDAARRKMIGKYPAPSGYVISSVEEKENYV